MTSPRKPNLHSYIKYKSCIVSILFGNHVFKFQRNLQSITFENDLHNAANLDVSFGEISEMLHPSVEALAVLPLL